MMLRIEMLLQVILAFVVSAYTTLALILLFYGAGYIKKTKHSRIDNAVLYLLGRSSDWIESPGANHGNFKSAGL